MARNSTYSAGTSREVPLLDYAPDLDPATPGILLDMEGADPSFAGYTAADTPEQWGQQLTQADPPPLGARGATMAYSANGEHAALIVGTTNHLYRYDVSQPGLKVPVRADGGQTIGIPPNARWRFFQFGNQVVALAGPGITATPQVAASPLDDFAPIQSTDIGGGKTYPPPGAAVGTAAGGTGFLFDGNVWYASAPGTIDNLIPDPNPPHNLIQAAWIPDVQTLAASGTLYDLPGPVLAAAPYYRSVIAWKQQGMWIGNFVGPPLSWSFQLISTLTGTYSQECVVVLPEMIAFLGTDDFYITTGSTPQRIPNNLKEWFFNTVNREQLARTQGWYHSDAAIIYWHFVSNNSPDPTLCDMFVSYNVRSRRWGKGSRLVQCVPDPASTPDLVANPPVDHIHGIYFDDQSTPQDLDGPPGAMHLLTGWQGDPGRLTQLMRVRPKFNLYPQTQTLMSWHTNILSQVPPFPPFTIPAPGADDWFNLRQYDRYHQVGLSTSGPAEVVAFAYEGRLGGIR